VESRTRNGSIDKDTSTTILPESLHIPAIGLKLSVEPMGWEVTAIGDEQLTTQWQLPDSTIGWHTNSAYAGAGGNVVLSMLSKPFAMRSSKSPNRFYPVEEHRQI